MVIALGFALATPTSAMAAARCEDFMLSCVIDGIPESVNVRKLMSNSKLRKYVQRHARACSLMANSNEPYGCDWKATVRLGAAPATERTNSHHEPAGGANNHDDSAPGSNDAQAPTPRRDAGPGANRDRPGSSGRRSDRARDLPIRRVGAGGQSGIPRGSRGRGWAGLVLRGDRRHPPGELPCHPRRRARPAGVRRPLSLPGSRPAAPDPVTPGTAARRAVRGAGPRSPN